MVNGKQLLILFDGHCKLCNFSVQFIGKRAPAELFAFEPLQSEQAKEILARYNVPPGTNSMVLIEEGKVYLRSTAALRIARRLRGLWPLLYVAIVIPAPLRDPLYDFIARHRARWFGTTETCSVLEKEN